MKRLPLFLAGLSLLALLATACGGGAPTATSAPTPPPAEAVQPKLVYFYADW
jgi:ABC-type glycerol-3-phosphate transport system substrate-binding protein